MTITDATTLTLDIEEIIDNDGSNRVLTSDGDGTLTAESNLTVNGAVISIGGSLARSVAGHTTVNADVMHSVVNAVSTGRIVTLPTAGGLNSRVFRIKNMDNSPMTINTFNPSEVFESNLTSTDSRYISPTQLELQPRQTVLLQAIEDSIVVPDTGPLQLGWLIVDNDTNTNTGILNVAEDTTPQLGGDLDVNGNKITSASNGDVEIEPNGTGDIILDGDVTVDTAHSFLAAKLPNATKTTSTLGLSDAGKYLFVTASGQTITLPVTHSAGEHYTILANGNDVTLSSGNNMNGSSGDITISSYNGVTCISDGTNWIVLGA